MHRHEIQTTRTGSRTVLTRLYPVIARLGLDASQEPLATTVVTGSTAVASSHRTVSTRRLSTGARRLLWLKLRPALSVEVAALGLPVRPPADAAVGKTGSHWSAGRKPPATSKIELTIDSLPTYELIKPIPVVVEALGDRHYLAEVPGSSISITGSNLGDTMISLKDHLTDIYDGLRIKRYLDKERAQQLKLLESYIGKTKRGWF